MNTITNYNTSSLTNVGFYADGDTLKIDPDSVPAEAVNLLVEGVSLRAYKNISQKTGEPYYKLNFRFDEASADKLHQIEQAFYKAACKDFREAVRDAKEATWQDYASSLDCRRRPAEV